MKSSSAFRSRVLVGVAAVSITGFGIAAAQTGQSSSSSSSDSSSGSTPAAPQQQTVSKPLSKKEIARKQKALEKELMGPWKKWMNEDVVYIITDEERAAFKRLKTDEERQQFVEPSGSGVTPLRTPKKTSTKKSITAVSLTRMTITRPVFLAGRPIAA